MIRLILTTSLLALTAPAFAETFTTDAKVDAVTIYPGAATVSRLVNLDLPAGTHDVIVPGLPEDLVSDGLRLSAPNGVQIGAVNLAFDRLPVTPDLTAPQIIAAQEEVERLEDILRQKTAAIAEIRLQVQAAEEQIAFLQSLAQTSAGENIGALAAGDLQALAQMVGSQTLAARQAAFEAEQEAMAAERAREDDVEALERAQQALRALTAPANDGAVLTFTVSTAEAGNVTVEVSTIEGYAAWSPVYDMYLTTGDTPRLDLNRSVVVSQSTGQDWTDVRLTLSTARPGEQIAPSPVWAQLRRIISEEELEQGRRDARAADAVISGNRSVLFDFAAEPELAPAIAPMEATANFSGATVTYSYPGRVSIRDGVEDLRLPLDTLTMDAKVWAEAVPSRDTTAYRMAEFTNDTQEVLLPGRSLLFADGTMIGFSQLSLLAAGAEAKIGFGPLDGLLLTRTTDSRSEGERGVFSTENRLEDAAIITVENVTGQDWRVLLRDAVPYSEQENLEVTYTSRPEVTTEKPNGQRGLLEWEFDVASGEKQVITLNYTLTWPDGYVLQ